MPLKRKPLGGNKELYGCSRESSVCSSVPLNKRALFGSPSPFAKRYGVVTSAGLMLLTFPIAFAVSGPLGYLTFLVGFTVVLANLFRLKTLPFSWQIYRFDDAGLTISFPASPQHRILTLVRERARDVRQHNISWESEQTHLEIEVTLFKWNSRWGDSDELADHRRAVRILMSGLNIVSSRVVRRGGHCGIEVVHHHDSKLKTVWHRWSDETPFSGGTSWVILTAWGDQDSVMQFLESYQVIPSEWLLEELRRWQRVQEEIP
jgi:hypothetical protein